MFGLTIAVFLNIDAQQLSLFSTQTSFQKQTAHFYSAVSNTSKNEVMVGGVFSSGIYKDFRKIYASAIMTSTDSLHRHAYGIIALQDERGELITETRVEGLYRIYVPVTDDIHLGIGTHCGIYQMGLEASTTTAGDNDLSFNINLSGGVFSRLWSFGGYVMSLTSPTFQLLNSEVPLSSIYGGYLTAKLLARKDWKSALTIHTTKIVDELFLIGSLDQVYQGDYLFGVQLGNNAVGTYVGLTNVQIGPRQLSFSVGYQYSYEVREVSDISRIQLMLQIF